MTRTRPKDVATGTRRTAFSMLLGLTVSILMVLAAAGCGSVKPWERGRLANDCMQLVVDPYEKSGDEHVLAVREGSAGGMTLGGGGCGCN